MDMRKGNRVLKILAKFLVAFILVKLVLKREPFIKAGCYRRKEFIYLNYYNRVNTGITECVEATPELSDQRTSVALSWRGSGPGGHLARWGGHCGGGEGPVGAAKGQGRFDHSIVHRTAPATNHLVQNISSAEVGKS